MTDKRWRKLTEALLVAGIFLGVIGIYWSQQGSFASLTEALSAAYGICWLGMAWRRLAAGRAAPGGASGAAPFILAALPLLALPFYSMLYFVYINRMAAAELTGDQLLPAANETSFEDWRLQVIATLAAIYLTAFAPWLALIFMPRYRAVRGRAVLGLLLTPLAPLPVITVIVLLMWLPLR